MSLEEQLCHVIDRPRVLVVIPHERLGAPQHALLHVTQFIRERELLALKYGAELTNRAITRVTGLSESNVGTILHRTIQQLRAGWDEGE